jgi:SAM-dependent methyltransferase
VRPSWSLQELVFGARFDRARSSRHTGAVDAASHIIFDRSLARRRLARALKGGPESFLLDRVAEDLLDRLQSVLRPFSDALDFGTPGLQVARGLAARSDTVTVTRAAPLAERTDGSDWCAVVADEELVPFAPERFDLVVSALALHTINDLPGTLAQLRRVLKPDGLFLACLAGGQTLQELRGAFAAAEAEMEGGASPRVSPFADLRDMGSLLQRAGFALPVTDVDTIIVRYDHLFALMRDLRAMGATNVLVQRSRKPLRRATLLRAAEIYAERYADADGRIRATFEFVWLSGWAPHESQQKPLKPGSAQMRLADALGTTEIKPDS